MNNNHNSHPAQSKLNFVRESVAAGKKLFAVLLDPDKITEKNCTLVCQSPQVDLILVGGSLLSRNLTRETIQFIKSKCDKPVFIFPGNAMQVEDNADALLFLSLISGRNPDMLIGQHVAIAPQLNQMDLEVIPTGYILVDSAKPTAALYMSQSLPIPADKPDIACATALAGEFLGMQMIYMDGGSGAHDPINTEMIQQVKQVLKPETPLFVGGGIDTVDKIKSAYQHGADVVVVGNKLESDPEFIFEITETALHS